MTVAARKLLRSFAHCACLLAVMAASPVFAVDGIVLIDQNKALAGNVTPGDAPGFPVTISLPGSYRLAGNLTVPSADTSAIVIAPGTPGVTIDLNGFAIVGPTSCSGFPLVCSPLGSGMGISAASDATNVTRGINVRNGTVMGMGSAAVYLIPVGGAVDNMTIISNGGDGLFIELGTATNNRIIKNGGNGISGGNSVITQNMISGNRFAGISVNDSIATNNALITNGSYGLAASNTGFASNTFSSNNGSFLNPQFTGRNPIGPNLCDGSVCP